MKKILFFIGDLNLSGGTERVATTIANALVNKGYQVSFINLVDGQTPFFALDGRIGNSYLFKEKIPFTKNYHKVIFRLRRAVKKEQADIFIDVESMLAMFSCVALLGTGIRHICWEHFNFKIDLGKKTRRIARQMALMMADDIVVLTKKDQQFWQDGAWWQRAKIIQIYNPSPFSTSPDEPCLDSKTFLAVGRYTSQKGFDLLIKAWALVKEQLTDWQLLIVGEGEDRAVLERLIVQHELQDNITLTGRTADVASYYKKASFYVLSSRFEGFGMTMIEAQAFGVPVIAFNCDCGPDEIVENGVSGFLCNENNVDALANLMLEKSKISSEEYTSLVKNSQNNVKRFSVEKILKYWECLFNED